MSHTKSAEIKWDPDPKVIAYLKEKAASVTPACFLVGLKKLSWDQVLHHVQVGTGFGRSYHQALHASIHDEAKAKK